MTVLTTPATIDAVLATATREVLVARATRNRTGDPLRRADHENLRRGVRYRVLLPESVRDDAGTVLRLGLLAPEGAEVRTVPEVPADVTVLDGAVAVLARDRSSGEVAVVRLPGVVDTAVALFARLWSTARPLTAGDAPGDRERELLALLSAGHTDESAAARLGVSVRTVRRIMSALMEQLGARSRFQAGIRAADRGMLVPLP